MKLDFPDEADSDRTLQFIRCFQDWALTKTSAEKTSLECFFESLAKILAETFEVPLVTVWDNNEYGDCLVLQASAPRRLKDLPYTIPIDDTNTGDAIKTKMISLARVENEILLAEGIDKMVSIPVFNSANSEIADLVINLYYGSSIKPQFPFVEEDAARLLSRFSTVLQNQIYKRGNDIESKVRHSAASAQGIPSLFDSVTKNIQAITHCTYTELYTCNDREQLSLEGRFFFNIEETFQSGKELSGSEKFLASLKDICVGKKSPYVYVEKRELNLPVRSKEKVTRQCKYVAVPVISSKDTVIGVLACGDPIEGERLAPSFSSFDVHALQTFSNALSPSIERFLLSRQESLMIKIIKEVSDSMVTTYKLNKSLKKAIEKIVETLHSEIGSVYLREEETDVFVMRAAKGANEKLIGKARYKVGEGITGAIAEGQLLHFKSREEMSRHRNYKGKYDEEIWGDKPDQKETFLGVPIIIRNKVIGVFKVSNAIPTAAHPDPYYTDEDIQISQVLSSLLAYAIQNYEQEAKRIKQFESLVNTSLEIQKATNEEDAIISVLLNLADTEVDGVLLSLYDSQTKNITGKYGVGNYWRAPWEQYVCSIDDKDDSRAKALRNNTEELGNSLKNEISHRKDIKELVIPLRLDEELLGTLQFNLGTIPLSNRRKLILKATASHLAIAVSRLRSIRQTIDLTNNIIVSARFVTAETVSAMAIHSIHHKLKDLNKQIRDDLAKKDVRENRFLLETLKYWEQAVREMEIELKNILNFVRAPSSSEHRSARDVHPQIQASISTWYNYARAHNCKFLPPRLDAKNSFCRITNQAFREILSVLIVNAVQAHAKNIRIITYNEKDALPPDVIHSAFCLEFSDDGTGLSTDNYEEIFDPNYTTKPPNVGSGLGLFVARRLAWRSGGELEVLDTEQRKETTFRLILPFKEI